MELLKEFQVPTQDGSAASKFTQVAVFPLLHLRLGLIGIILITNEME